jgi:hypothetical protein
MQWNGMEWTTCASKALQTVLLDAEITGDGRWEMVVMSDQTGKQCDVSWHGQGTAWHGMKDVQQCNAMPEN